MAARRKAKSVGGKKASEPKSDAPAAGVAPTDKPKSKPAPPAKTEPRSVRRTARAKAKPKKRGPATRQRPSSSPKRATRRPRSSYSATEKARILKLAVAQSLTAKQVQAKFGVKPVTYYLWRKNAKAAGRGGLQGTLGGRLKNNALPGMVRADVQARLRAMLPEILRSEVAAYLERAFRKGS